MAFLIDLLKKIKQNKKTKLIKQSFKAYITFTKLYNIFI